MKICLKSTKQAEAMTSITTSEKEDVVLTFFSRMMGDGSMSDVSGWVLTFDWRRLSRLTSVTITQRRVHFTRIGVTCVRVHNIV
jgi:YD repeat-containing protein